MKLLVGLLVFISSVAFGSVRSSWTNAESILTMGNSPIRGYFYVSTFTVTDTSCDEFNGKVKVLIQDWKKYNTVNMYALTLCTNTDSNPNIVFFYGIDLWRQDGIAAHQQFLKDHQGMVFEGQTLDFSPVTNLVVRSDLMLAKKTGSKVTSIHRASTLRPYQYEDLWYPDYLNSVAVVGQDDKDTFLRYVGAKFGVDEKIAFGKALLSSNFLAFGDFFTLTLANGKTANMWFGFGADKDCGGSACFGSAP